MAGSDEGVGVQLSVILTGHATMPRGYVYRAPGNVLSKLRAGLVAGEDALRVPCLAYVVRHPAAGTLLIDTGFHPDAGRDLRRDFGLTLGLVMKSIEPAREPFDAQLRTAGVEPESVESVLMTHLHADHTSGMRLLPNATFTCARAEWEATRSRFPARGGYAPGHLPPRERMRLVDFEADGVPYGPFDRTVDLLGDGSIRLVYTPGHTPGHMSALVRLDDGDSAMVVGDAAYTLHSIEEGVLPLLTADDGQSVRSLRALKSFAEQNPQAVVVPTHDPDAWRALPNTDRAPSGAV